MQEPIDTPTPRPDRSALVAWIGLAAIVGVLLLIMVRAKGRGRPHPAAGERLTMVELQPLTGGGSAVGLSELQGKVTLINFWGTWCYHCMRELPHLVELRKKFANDPRFQMLLVSCSTQWQPLLPPGLGWTEDVPKLRDVTARDLAARKLDGPTYLDPRGRTRDAFAALDGWQGYPTTLLLDQQGVIRDVWIGFTPGAEDQMERRVIQLLQASEPASVEPASRR